MHNINIIHRSFFSYCLASPVALPFLFLSLTCPCPACFLALPNSLPCLCLLPSAYAFCLWPSSYAYFLCLLPVSLPLPISLPCLFPCPAYFRALPIDLLFYECTLHGYIASKVLF